MEGIHQNNLAAHCAEETQFQTHGTSSVNAVVRVTGNNVTDSYSSGLAFSSMAVKAEKPEGVTHKLSGSSIRFQPSVVVSTSQLKNDQGQILNAVVSQETFSNSRNVLINTSSSSTKVMSNQTMLPIGQGVDFNSSGLSISNINTITSGATLVPSTLNNTIINQPLQVYQSTSFDNCENVMESQANSGQTFLLASPNSVLSSNQIMAHGQVFIQGDELVGVSLPTSVSNSYTLSNADAQFGTAMSVIQSVPQTSQSTGTPTRLVIQTNQANSHNISNPVISSQNGHYLIQVGNSLPTISANSNFSISNKGHIVIKSGLPKVKLDPDDLLDSVVPKEGIFRVIIPEGTTKLPKPIYPIKTSNNGDEAIRKHVQINLSNRASFLPQKFTNYDTASVQTVKIPIDEKQAIHPHRKLYECTNCCSKFMKALNLRMHIRSCKKPEVKQEKTPLYMCSFCKTTFKTKPLINSHFSKCASCPYAMKEAAEKSEIEVPVNEGCLPPCKKTKLINFDTSLEHATQYKCQDCDRTFSKERQYTSHIKRCTKVSVHDMSAMKTEPMVENQHDDDNEMNEDPFADPPPMPSSPTSRRGRGTGGRRGRPPGRMPNAAMKAAHKNSILFEGEKVEPTFGGLIVADNENLVRSTTGLAHTLQLSLETASQEGQPQPLALVSDSKGVRGRDKPPQAWSLVCSLCQKMFLTKVALATHVIENHGADLRATRDILKGKDDEIKNLFRCPVCHLHYQSEQHFLEHLVMQHTNRLQECHKDLQSQTASFICSLCSLVLLTKNILMEHLSLEHLDELEKIEMSMSYSRKKKLKQAEETSPKTLFQDAQECLPPDFKVENENPLECRYCGEESESQETLKSHYVNGHGVDTDAAGNILDLGCDVDIRIKDTQTLIQLADGKVDDSNLPPKTVLIRKKPKQSWQCQSCQQIFTRQAVWLKHVRESCPNVINSNENSKSLHRECRFYCLEPECSQLAFLQFKSLVKHKEETHNIIVNKERKVFKNLSLFYQWLSAEENDKNIFFIRDSTRVEKNNVRLIQMVCHRFHTAKTEHSKDSQESDYGKPTKKRWFVRRQKENNCYARIYLRAEYDKVTADYDGETQMIYYPEHFHNGVEDTPEVLESIQAKFPHKKLFNSKSNGAFDVDSGSSQGIDSPGDMFLEDNESSNVSADTLTMEEASQLLEYSPSTSRAVVFSSNEVSLNTMNSVALQQGHSTVSREPRLILPHRTGNNSIIVQSNGETRFVMPSRVSDGNMDSKAILLEGSEANTYMVMDVDQHDSEQEMNEEYVLPADEAEWTKLFDVLSNRVSSDELFGDERKEAETLISYRNLIAMTSLSQQVDIFQRMCSLTNIESS